MENFEIIDAHIHMAKSQEEEINWWKIPGRSVHGRWASPEHSAARMDRNGISKMVVLVILPTFTRPSLAEKGRLEDLPEKERREGENKFIQQLSPIIRDRNEWVCQTGQQFPRLIPFVCMAKDLGDSKAMVEELTLRFNQGAKGVKLHPGMHGFYPNDREFWPMYEKCQELGLPVLADSGPWDVPRILVGSASHLHQKQKDYGEPKNFEQVLKDFPKLTLVLAHLGSAWWDVRVELAQKYPNVYFDISQGFAAPDRIPHASHRSLAEEDAVRIMRKIGIERIMFGTDGPAVPIEPQMEQFLRLPLKDKEKRMILAENAKRIYNI